MSIGVLASPDWTDCPMPCLCKWTNGKKSALCASSNLTTIPSLNSDVQVLNLQQNFITYLKKDEFSSAGLLNLQKIFLKSSSLKEIHRDAFRDLKILIEIDLSGNYISVIPRDTFAGNDRLKVLILSGNPLKQLFNEQFPTLPHLRSLELENCQIHLIAREAFIHLDQLEKLNLRRNELEGLSEAVFMPILNLKSLSLEGNPWRCDCALRAFRNWYLMSKLHSVSMTCSDPKRLKGKLWEDTPSADFACPPEVIVTERIIKEDVGGNVTFGCHIKGDPEPDVTWYFNGYQIGSPNASHPDQMLILEIEEGLVDKWINVSIFNLTKYDAGEYACLAKNFLGKVVKNVTLFVQQETVLVTLSKTETVIPIVGLIGGGVFTLAVVVVVLVCTCVFFGYQRRRRRHRRKGRIKGSGSFTDQDKKLLDVSITTSTERQSGTQSMEMFSSCQGDLKMPESSSSMTMELCEPVQISLDRHNQDGMIPIAAAYPAAFGLAAYPQALDYSSRMLPTGGYGNIFISVSVSKDPFLDSERYPDLLEIPCKSKGVVGPEFPYCGMPVSSYATLPRRPARSAERQQPGPGPLYDKLGRRVTMQGSSTLSLPDAQNEETQTSESKEPVITLEVDEYVSL